MGASYYNIGRFKEALEFVEEALKLTKELDDESLNAYCYPLFTSVYNSLGNYRKAIECNDKTLETANKLRNKTLKIKYPLSFFGEFYLTISIIVQKSDLIRLHKAGVVFCSKCGNPIVIGELIVGSGSYVRHENCKNDRV